MTSNSLTVRMLFGFAVATLLLVSYFLAYPSDPARSPWMPFAGAGLLLGLAVVAIVDMIITMVRLVRRVRFEQDARHLSWEE